MRPAESVVAFGLLFVLGWGWCAPASGQERRDRKEAWTVPLGLVEMDGGTESFEVDASAPPRTGGRDLESTVVNRMAKGVTKLVVGIHAMIPEGSTPPPVARGLIRQRRTTVPGVVRRGNILEFDLRALRGGALVGGDRLELEVGLGEPPAGAILSTLVVVTITPLVPGPTEMPLADVYEECEFAGPEPLLREMQLHGNAAGYARVRHGGPKDGPLGAIVLLEGRLDFQGQRNRIVRARLVDPSLDYSVIADATAKITSSTSFAVSGFSLQSGEGCAVLVEFESTPPPGVGTKLQLTPKFEN